MKRRPRRPRGGVAPIPHRGILKIEALPYTPLDDAAVDAIHASALEILATTGIEMWNVEARAIIKECGGRVNEAAQRVWLDPGLVQQQISAAPETIAMKARDPNKNLTVGGQNIVFGAVGGSPFVSDLDKGRRYGTLDDLRRLNKLIHVSDVLALGGGHLIEPVDIPVSYRHLETTYCDITLTDKMPRATALGGIVARDIVTMMALVHAPAGATTDEAIAALVTTPVVMAVISVNSPLRYDGPMLEGLIELANHGQVPIITPFIMIGAMSPITLPAAIAQQHAEVLAGIVLAQCVNPGCPVIYGGFITPLDMQSGAVPFGTPEATWTLAAGAQMARHVGLPFRSSGALTTSQLPDAQAAYESLFNLWPAVMARTNVILQAAGWLDGGLVASFEKFMLDIELIERLFAVYRAPRVDTTALALDQIDAIGPGGHHLDSDYTRKRYRNAFFRSTLSSLAPHETWRDEGGLDAAQRANRAWKDKLSAYKPPPIDQGVVEALDAYKSRRIEQIMGAEGDTLSSR